VRVLYLHATPASHAQTLRRHLAWLQEQFHVIDFAASDRIVRAPSRPPTASRRSF
jgi:hypothetical protein